MSKTKCPQCDRPAETKDFHPFCSKRCADVDLSRWLKGGYVIPGRPSDDADSTPSAEAPRDE